MHSLIKRFPTQHSPTSLALQLAGRPGLLLFESAGMEGPCGRYSLVAACPFLVFRSCGDRCEITVPQAKIGTAAKGCGGAGRDFGSASGGVCWPCELGVASTEDSAGGLGSVTACQRWVLHGNPWEVLSRLIDRYLLPDEIDLPFPAGGCFGFWGYDLKDFVEPKLRPRALKDLGLPDCCVGFYDSVVVFDRQPGSVWICATGLAADGSRTQSRAKCQAEFWNVALTVRSPRSW